MKFGKLTSVEDVVFKTPHLKFVQPNTDEIQPLKIFLGTTGWSNKEWLGSYYPKKAKTNEYLTHYGGLFNTIELNTTHYQIPSPDRIEGWSAQVSNKFRFCPKVPQVISHRYNIASEISETGIFYKALEGFQDKLGPCFMQLPEQFAPSRKNELLHFLSRKPTELNFAVELRHKEWFQNNNAHLNSLAKDLSHYNTSLVVSDVAGRRDVCHGILSNSKLIIRLVGNNLHLSDYQRMDQWIERIKASQQGLEEVYVFFHQPSMLQIPEMVNYFIENLDKNGLISPVNTLKTNYRDNIQLRLF